MTTSRRPSPRAMAFGPDRESLGHRRKADGSGTREGTRSNRRKGRLPHFGIKSTRSKRSVRIRRIMEFIWTYRNGRTEAFGPDVLPADGETPPVTTNPTRCVRETPAFSPTPCGRLHPASTDRTTALDPVAGHHLASHGERLGRRPCRRRADHAFSRSPIDRDDGRPAADSLRSSSRHGDTVPRTARSPAASDHGPCRPATVVHRRPSDRLPPTGSGHAAKVNSRPSKPGSTPAGSRAFRRS